MNIPRLKEHLIIIYLASILIILLPPTAIKIATILIPLLIISLGIHLKHSFISILGLSIFYLISLQHIIIASMEDITQLLLFLILISVPSLFLLSYILQLSHSHQIIFTTKEKKPLSITIILALFILITFYLIALFTPSSSILSAETIEVQILIIAALSIFTCLPLLIK
jgi:hypothetical protein